MPGTGSCGDIGSNRGTTGRPPIPPNPDSPSRPSQRCKPLTSSLSPLTSHFHPRPPPLHLHPIPRNTPQAPAAQYRTRHSRSISSPTRRTVHFLRRIACGPRSSCFSTRFNCSVCSFRGLPSRPAFSAQTPPRLTFFAHPPTDCRRTPSRRATSACQTPSRSSRAPSIRRRSSPEKFRRPARIPLINQLSHSLVKMSVIY